MAEPEKLSETSEEVRHLEKPRIILVLKAVGSRGGL